MSETQRQADKAQRELDITEGLFDRMKANAAAAWLASDEKDPAGRERLFLQVKAIEAVQAELHLLVAEGEVEAYAEQVRADLGS